MESVQIQALYEPPLAAKPQLSEKPHQGFATRQTASHQGSSVCNFTVTLGLQATVVENGVRETYSARYYNPATGRFMSRDPENGYINDPASLHKYLYAGGDPVNRIDPSGRADFVDMFYEFWMDAMDILAERLLTKAVADKLICVALTLLSAKALGAAGGVGGGILCSALI
jgi:RHS repeat-associated protein